MNFVLRAAIALSSSPRCLSQLWFILLSPHRAPEQLQDASPPPAALAAHAGTFTARRSSQYWEVLEIIGNPFDKSHNSVGSLVRHTADICPRLMKSSGRCHQTYAICPARQLPFYVTSPTNGIQWAAVHPANWPQLSRVSLSPYLSL